MGSRCTGSSQISRYQTEFVFSSWGGNITLVNIQIKDFWREAHIISNLHHPNVVAFYGVVPNGPGGTMATVTEYMVNGSLRLVLTKKDR